MRAQFLFQVYDETFVGYRIVWSGVDCIGRVGGGK